MGYTLPNLKHDKRCRTLYVIVGKITGRKRITKIRKLNFVKYDYSFAHSYNA